MPASISKGRPSSVPPAVGMLVLTLFPLFPQIASAQAGGRNQCAVGTFNAPEIRAKDHGKLDFALRKSLTASEYENLGKGIMTIRVELNNKGKSPAWTASLTGASVSAP